MQFELWFDPEIFEYLPIVHTEQIELPFLSVNVPGRHFVQFAFPIASVPKPYVPLSHGTGSRLGISQ